MKTKGTAGVATDPKGQVPGRWPSHKREVLAPSLGTGRYTDEL